MPRTELNEVGLIVQHISAARSKVFRGVPAFGGTAPQARCTPELKQIHRDTETTHTMVLISALTVYSACSIRHRAGACAIKSRGARLLLDNPGRLNAAHIWTHPPPLATPCTHTSAAGKRARAARTGWVHRTERARWMLPLPLARTDCHGKATRARSHHLGLDQKASRPGGMVW